MQKEPNTRFLPIFKFDWSDEFNIAYTDVAQSVVYDLVNFYRSYMIVQNFQVKFKAKVSQ